MSIVRGDDRWIIRGGRGGHVSYTEGDLRAELSFELAGGNVAMIIYGDRCRWTAPDPRKMGRDDVYRLVGQLAGSMAMPIELVFSDLRQMVGQANPTAKARWSRSHDPTAR
jgi:hypothetical protein